MQNRLQLADVVETIRQKTGMSSEPLMTICRLFLEGMGDFLMAGENVTLAGYLRFYWQKVPPKSIRLFGRTTVTKLPARYKLRVHLANRFQGGFVMDKGGMDKYGVELETEKVKQASKDGQPDTCLQCGKKLDSGGACPEHGTEPLEKRNK